MTAAEVCLLRAWKQQPQLTCHFMEAAGSSGAAWAAAGPVPSSACSSHQARSTCSARSLQRKTKRTSWWRSHDAPGRALTRHPHCASSYQAACSNIGTSCAQCVRMAPSHACIHEPWNMRCSSDSAMLHMGSLPADQKEQDILMGISVPASSACTCSPPPRPCCPHRRID